MKLSSKLSKGLVFALLTSFLWACSIVNSRFMLLQGEHPLNLATWISLTTLLPWIIILGKHKQSFAALSGKIKWYLVAIGIAASIGIDYLQSLALANSPAVNFSFLYRTVVIFTIILAYTFFKEKITAKKWLLAGLILFGSYLLTTRGAGINLTTGDIYTLIYAASAAFISNILIKHTVAKMHPDVSGASISIVATVSLLVFSLILNILHYPKNIFLIFLSALLSLLITMVRNRAYKYATASFVTMIVSLTPVFVTLLSYPLLHERMDMYQIIGGSIIVGSMFLVERFNI